MKTKKSRRVSRKTGQASKKTGRQEKILRHIYEYPEGQFSTRELAKCLGISRSTVQHYLQVLRKENIISQKNEWIDSWNNKVLKSQYYVTLIMRSGLVEFLEEELAASAVILFGSFSKGDSVKESDIDIFVQCARERKLDLSAFEKKLGHSIELFTRKKVTLLPKHLLNNVVNGVKLKGYFTVK